MPVRCTVRVEFTCKGVQLADAIERSVRPELLRPPTSRSRVSMTREGETVRMTFEALDISALRAALNSYLRWVSAVESVLRTLGLDAAVS